MTKSTFTALALALALSTAGTLGILSPARAQTPANSRHALVQTVAELNVDGVSLSKVMDYFRDVTNANIVVNWKVLEAAGVTKDTPITITVRSLPLHKMLQLVLDQASPNAALVYSVDSNVIQITTQEEADKQMVTKVYIVDDLVMVPNSQNAQPPQFNLQALTQGGSQQVGQGGGGFGGGGGGGGGGNGGGNQGLFTNANGGNNSQQPPQETSDQRGQDLVNLIEAIIRPNIWKDNGGAASIRYFTGKLIVTAPVSVQEAIGGPVGDDSVRYGN